MTLHSSLVETYTIPSYIIDTAVEATDGQVTVTEANHGLALGDDLEIIKASSPIDLFAKQSVEGIGRA